MEEGSVTTANPRRRRRWGRPSSSAAPSTAESRRPQSASNAAKSVKISENQVRSANKAKQRNKATALHAGASRHGNVGRAAREHGARACHL